MTRLALVCVAVLAALSVWSSSAAAAPCFGCASPTSALQPAAQSPQSCATNPNLAPCRSSGSAALPPTQSDPQTITPSPSDAAQSNPRRVDATARSQSVFTGPLKQDEFDPADWNLWYVVGDWKVALQFAPDVHLPNGGDMTLGLFSDILFTGYKYAVHGVLQLVGLLVYGIAFVKYLLPIATKLSDEFHDTISTPFNLAAFCMAIAACYFGWAWFVLRRHGLAVVEGAMSAVVIALAATLGPLGPAVRYLVSLFAGIAATLLLAAQGQNPRSVPSPSTGPLNTTTLENAYQGFINKLEDLMIARVAEVLTFGQKLPAVCREPYLKGVAQHLDTRDPDNFKFLMQVHDCQPFVAEQALQPDATRFICCVLLILYSLAFVYICGKLAWPFLKGQVQLMAAVAGSSFLVAGLALPGALRAGFALAAIRVFLGVMAIVSISFFLGIALLFMGAILTATTSLPLIVSFALTLFVPFGVAMLAKAWKGASERGAKKTAAAATSADVRTKASGERSGRTGGAVRYKGGKLVAGRNASVAHDVALAAAGGAVVAGGKAVLTAKQKVSRGSVGKADPRENGTSPRHNTSPSQNGTAPQQTRHSHSRATTTETQNATRTNHTASTQRNPSTNTPPSREGFVARARSGASNAARATSETAREAYRRSSDAVADSILREPRDRQAGADYAARKALSPTGKAAPTERRTRPQTPKATEPERTSTRQPTKT